MIFFIRQYPEPLESDVLHRTSGVRPRYGHKDVLQLFLDQRADVGVINNEGRSRG